MKANGEDTETPGKEIEVITVNYAPGAVDVIDINLSTGRSFSYDVSGTQNVQRGSAILRLKGLNEETASFLTLYTQGADHV